jgi:general secretion pathway protein F
MPAFEYVALDAAGNRKRGVLEGDSDRGVRQLIRQKGLTLLKLAELNQRTGSNRKGSKGLGLFTPRLRGDHLAMMTRLLSALIRSGLPLDDALQAAAEQTEHNATRRVMLGVRSRVLEGQSLSQAMETMPGVFPDLYTATVSAGEQTPKLGLILDRLADYIEEQQHMKQKLQVAMLYPGILTITAILVIAGLLTYVVPEVVKIFDNMDQKLPLLTVGLIAVADFVKHWGLYVLAGIIAGVVLFRQVLKRPGPRRSWHLFLLRVPIVGRILREADAGRFTRTLSVLLQSGVSMLEALRITSKALVMLPMREAIAQAATNVHEGVSLHRAIQQTKRIPPLTVHLIANGEASGNLETMLETASRTHDRNVQTTLATLMALLEPLLILTMGVIVCLIVVAILLPIFDLNTMV